MKIKYQLAPLMILAFISYSVCEYCTNDRGAGNNSWGGSKKTVDGKLLKCSEWSTKGSWCLNTCEKRGEGHYWCQTGKVSELWGYCSPKGKTILGNECHGRCQKYKDEYYFCYIDDQKDNWDYCSPDGKVTEVKYSITGQECGGECAKYGESYYWCQKPQRWKGSSARGGRKADSTWDKCSPNPKRTVLGESCKSKCSTEGENYYWCKTESSWDYCGPSKDFSRLNSSSAFLFSSSTMIFFMSILFLVFSFFRNTEVIYAEC